MPILESFGDLVPASLKAAALNPYHVDRWLEDRGKRKVPVKGAGTRGHKVRTAKPLSATTERDYITLIAGAFKWAKAKDSNLATSAGTNWRRQQLGMLRVKNAF